MNELEQLMQGSISDCMPSTDGIFGEVAQAEEVKEPVQEETNDEE